MRDTTPAVLALQTAIHQKLTPPERLRQAIDMSDFTHRLAEAGVRMRNPDLDEAGVRAALLEALYGHRSERR